MSGKFDDGFSLPLAVLAIALIALSLSLTFPSAFNLAREIRDARSHLELQRTAISVESRVAYFLLTEPISARGVEIGGPRLASDGTIIPGELAENRHTLIFDGRAYFLTLDDGQTAQVRLQDEAGLINLNFASSRLLANLLNECGVAHEASSQIAARLTRFRDLSGGQMVRQQQSKGETIGDWEQLFSGDQKQALHSAITVTSHAKGINRLTAPIGVVMAVFGGDTAQAREFIRKREENDIAAIMAINSSQFEYKLHDKTAYDRYNSQSIRLTIQMKHSKLTDHLPHFTYETFINVNDEDPIGSFSPNGAVFNAGSGAQCNQSRAEAFAGFPSFSTASD